MIIPIKNGKSGVWYCWEIIGWTIYHMWTPSVKMSRQVRKRKLIERRVN